MLQVGFRFKDKKLLRLTVKEMEIIEMDENRPKDAKPRTVSVYLLSFQPEI